MCSCQSLDLPGRAESGRAATLVDGYKLTIRVKVLHLKTRVLPPLSAVPLTTVDKTSTHPQDQDQSGNHRGMALKSGPVCAYCKCRGHLLSECWALEKDKKKGSALVTTRSHSSRKIAAKTPDMFKPFILQGLSLWIRMVWRSRYRSFVIQEHLNCY